METMTISDVSKLLHITDDTARNRLAAGNEMPPSFRVGRRRLFLRSEVERWLVERASHPLGANSRIAHESKAD
ncbi:helix-turn-helix domain-containing protein [Caenimonas sedimenti]|uniref:Helix-turn-helix domain-containing protein n=1 Tax=Caenimonas sedimenti TaxID=2596921 RepID=A0A562ZDR0_9BURK|nr:helix-turn-helix domain-containing protein [Caenimonas sedimenti]TWO64407.1 helix-turn-helix domain-containing protein [Caenimonas sedimenti]